MENMDFLGNLQSELHAFIEQLTRQLSRDYPAELSTRRQEMDDWWDRRAGGWSVE
jgi:hypothetical protein